MHSNISCVKCRLVDASKQLSYRDFISTGEMHQTQVISLDENETSMIYETLDAHDIPISDVSINQLIRDSITMYCEIENREEVVG